MSLEFPVRRLLYLGFAFPPGMAAFYPESNPAGHALETRMIAQLRRYFDIRSTGVLPEKPPRLDAADPASGVAHEVALVEKPPELYHRYRSLLQLKAQYRAWARQGWEPDAVLVYNLSPIYNQFLLWLRRRPVCPALVLLLLDSMTLGQPVAWRKRFRRRFKPMHVADERMLPQFDACIGLSREVEKYFRPRRVPFLWMPGGCTPERALPEREPLFETKSGKPLRLGYFGALGPHSGVKALAETLLSSPLPATLDICGYGKQAPEVKSLAERDSRLRFRGLLSAEQCLHFGRGCDVLVNPRPATHGNRNNFASKLFEYALTGRPILTARLSGVESVLGSEAFYFDPHEFAPGLRAQLELIGSYPRKELVRRGAAIQRRVVTEFSWARQAVRMAQFINRICSAGLAELELRQALAA
jgi:glycosyltransferase involved in cell wall biosynthesis